MLTIEGSVSYFAGVVLSRVIAHLTPHASYSISYLDERKGVLNVEGGVAGETREKEVGRNVQIGVSAIKSEGGYSGGGGRLWG